MSLVAYASSGDDSDDEHGARNVSETKPDYVLLSDSRFASTGINLPAPSNVSGTLRQGVPKEDQLGKVLLLPLPKPKSGTIFATKEGDLEDFVKKNVPELSASEKNPVASKKRKIIKIAAPKLADSDSDDEDSVGKKTHKPSASKKMCGLFSVLPAPKNRTLGGGADSKDQISKMFSAAAVKKADSNIAKRVMAAPTAAPGVKASPKTTVTKTSVPFVPASVNRKPNQSSRSAFNLETGMMMTHRKKKVLSQPNADKETEKSESTSPAASSVVVSTSSMDVDSSDDEGGEASSNFFSIGEKEDVVHNNPLSASSLSVTSSISTLPSVGSKEMEAQKSGIPSPDVQNQPLSFKSRDNAAFQHTHSASQPSASTQSGSGHGYSNAYYDMTAQYEEGDGGTGDSTGVMGDDFEQDKEFLKMQGKSKRGKEEIKFIDVRQSDQIGEVDLNLIKHLSEENATRQSYNKKHNDDMPTSQQRKKHQITYLAFKAKEREVELKDAWAANRQNKRQTQSKYGF